MERIQNGPLAMPTEIDVVVETALAQIRSITLGAEDGEDKWKAALTISFGPECSDETRRAVLSVVAEEVHKRHGAMLGVMLRDPTTLRLGRPEKPMVEYGDDLSGVNPDGGVPFYRGSYNNGEYGDEYE